MALLDPTTPEGRLLMFKKDILPGRIEYAESITEEGAQHERAWRDVLAAKAEIERLERELSNG